jgi:high mobility group protein B1
MGKNKDKPRGRMSAYAFFVQTCREEHKKKHPSENVVFAEFSKKCAERWKTMNDKEKKRFHDMSDKDKKRYDSEMVNFKPAKGEQGGRKRKRTKDPNAPKRALSAFFWFCSDERSKVKDKNPDWTVGEVAKELGRRWADVTPDAKSKFEALAAKDKVRYERENKVYKSGSGKKPKASPPPKKGGQGGSKKKPAEDDDDDDDEEEEENDEGEDESEEEDDE